MRNGSPERVLMDRHDPLADPAFEQHRTVARVGAADKIEPSAAGSIVPVKGRIASVDLRVRDVRGGPAGTPRIMDKRHLWSFKMRDRSALAKRRGLNVSR